MWAERFHSWCQTQTVGVLSSCRSIFCFVYSKTIGLDLCFIVIAHELMGKNGLIKRENNAAQRRTRTHGPEIAEEIKSLMLYY